MAKRARSTGRILHVYLNSICSAYLSPATQSRRSSKRVLVVEAEERLPKDTYLVESSGGSKI